MSEVKTDATRPFGRSANLMPGQTVKMTHTYATVCVYACLCFGLKILSTPSAPLLERIYLQVSVE